MRPTTPLSFLEQAFNYVASADWLMVLLAVSTFAVCVIASCAFIEIFGTENDIGIGESASKNIKEIINSAWKEGGR